MKTMRSLSVGLASLACLAGCKNSETFKGTSGTEKPQTQNAVALVPTVVPVNPDVQFQESLPTYAVSKGSFSVWTDPVDPAPRQDYTIIIAINLPTGTSVYNRGDLTGSVTGTDNYHYVVQPYPNPSSEQFIFEPNGDAQLRVRIPGGAYTVRDKIVIRSLLLNEEQTIDIVF